LLKHPILDQLHALGLHGMAKAFAEIAASGEADGLGHHEWLGLLLDRETSWRQDKRFAARLRVAKLRQQACVEDVDYRNPRGLDRALFQKLIKGEWITAHDNLALIGPTGIGKSWLAAALGHKACRDNRSVLYQRVPRLFEDLALAHGDGRHPRLLRNLGRADLLILDGHCSPNSQNVAKLSPASFHRVSAGNADCPKHVGEAEPQNPRPNQHQARLATVNHLLTRRAGLCRSFDEMLR